MKMRIQCVSAAAIAVLGGWGLDTSQENVELEARVTELEAQIGEIEGYLQVQAKSAGALQTALDASEDAGFAFGINPESRHILLEAWHTRAEAVSANVPGNVPEKPE